MASNGQAVGADGPAVRACLSACTINLRASHRGLLCVCVCVRACVCGSDEMRPEWHKSTAMPYPKMWSDDQYVVDAPAEGFVLQC